MSLQPIVILNNDYRADQLETFKGELGAAKAAFQNSPFNAAFLEGKGHFKVMIVYVPDA